ncbi:LPS export ABC transporter permease LptG [Candidatus Binatia bacterium]|nr:LPS export ABC transporter permease LptG [Candidatus Binatia bacterium]
MTHRHRLPGKTASGYLIREFLALFAPILAAFVVLFIIIDFFERLRTFLSYDAAAVAILKYFFFKIPLMVTLVLPPAVVAATLLGLGMLARRNEIVAFRASGISLLQTAGPLLAMATVISLAALAWNETVVPYCAQRFQYVNVVEIKKQRQKGILSERNIWYHGANGFYSIDHLDPRRETLAGLTVYRTAPDFGIQTIIEAPSGQWKGGRWELIGAVERTVRANGEIETRPVDAATEVIPETLGDFLDVHREPEELSYLALRRRVLALSRKGIDPSPFLVDLHLKLAVPFMPLVLAAVAIPIAGRVSRHPSLAGTVGVGFAVGFLYWIVLGLANSLGVSGALPPAIAAWAANIIFALVAAALFLFAE